MCNFSFTKKQSNSYFNKITQANKKYCEKNEKHHECTMFSRIFIGLIKLFTFSAGALVKKRLTDKENYQIKKD